MNKIVLDSQGHTWGNHYWPVWMVLAFLTFIVPEAYSLFTDHGPNTLSAYVWRLLGTVRNESVHQWGALDFLTFGIYAVIVIWLAFHFWFGEFT